MRKNPFAAIPERLLLAYLLDDWETLGRHPEALQRLQALECVLPPRYFRRLWRALRSRVLAEYAKRHPGRRPRLWWTLEAPRMPAGLYPGAYFDGKLPQMRQRLGGRGTPMHEADPRWVPHSRFGLPVVWASYDPNDPPVYESQAAYLQRHGLLLPEERRRLKASDFAPEVAPERWEDYPSLTIY